MEFKEKLKARALKEEISLSPKQLDQFELFYNMLIETNKSMNLTAITDEDEVIEKHFTLDKTMEGPDHRASLNPEELKKMVQAIRNIEQSIGNGNKIASCSEMVNKAVARKSIVAKRNIRKGELLSAENLTTKRPGNGISPMKWYNVVGTSAIRDFNEDELIEL